MATSEDLEEELYCPICADLFDDPLMLPCTHSYCRKCLRERIEKGNVTRKSACVIFDCPVCRKEIRLDENGLNSLPRNRLLKKMVDLFRSHKAPKSRKRTEICEDHEKELGAFCSACKEVLCIDCVVGEHRGHPIESVDDVYHKQQRSLGRKKEELEEEIEVLRNSKQEEIKYMEQLKDHCKQKSETIGEQFDEYINLLQQSKLSILAEIGARQRKVVAKIQEVIDSISHREHELNETLKQLTQTIKSDKMKVLKESKLIDTSRLSTSRSSSGRDPLSSLDSDLYRTPRTRCFLDCTLQLDGAALESAINSAHLIWDADEDIYSPKHLSDKFTQLYEKEWKNAYMESNSRNKDDIVKQLFNVLTDSYRHAVLCSETHLESLTYHVLQPDVDVQVGQFNIHGFNNIEPESTESTTFCSLKESLRKLRAKHAPEFLQDVTLMIHHDISSLPLPVQAGSHKSLSVYANKCFELTFALRLQDPPLFVDIKDGDQIHELDKETYRFVKRRGRKTKTIAWPPLYLYKDGPLLAKGIAFVPG